MMDVASDIAILYIAAVLYWAMYLCVRWALRPKPGEWQASSPDWFWVHGTYEEFKPEQTDQQQSKPMSEAG